MFAVHMWMVWLLARCYFIRLFTGHLSKPSAKHAIVVRNKMRLNMFIEHMFSAIGYQRYSLIIETKKIKHGRKTFMRRVERTLPANILMSTKLLFRLIASPNSAYLREPTTVFLFNYLRAEGFLISSTGWCKKTRKE